MDRFFDRLGDILRTFLDDDPAVSRSGQTARTGDPDLDAAWEELDDFLGSGPGASRPKREVPPSGGDSAQNAQRSSAPRIPEALRRDFDELGVSFGASAAACKEAYKKMLKIHHPDRHAGHAGNMQKATAKTARLNSSYARIEAWRTTGRVE